MGEKNDFLELKEKEFCPSEYVYPGSRGTCFSSILSLAEGMMLMSTYEEFMVILATASLIVAILNLKNKK